MALEAQEWDKIIRQQGHYFRDSFLRESKRKELIFLIKKWDDLDSSKKVLLTDLFEEATTGDGILSWLKTKYNNVVGIDISFEGVKRVNLNKKFKGNLLVVSDVRRLGFKKESFDLIISDSTIDHFPQLDCALRELYRILKPQGMLILTLNNKFNFPFSFKLWFHRMLNIKDAHYGYSYSCNHLFLEVKKVGFEIKDITYIYFFPPLINFLYTFKKEFFADISGRLIKFYKRIMRFRFFKTLGGANIAMKLLKK